MSRVDPSFLHSGSGYPSPCIRGTPLQPARAARRRRRHARRRRARPAAGADRAAAVAAAQQRWRRGPLDGVYEVVHVCLRLRCRRARLHHGQRPRAASVEQHMSLPVQQKEVSHQMIQIH
jgi:hypothetical protein